MKYLEKTMDFHGQPLTLQFGKLAKASTTSVFAKLGETSVLVSVMAGKVRDDIDYFPLQVEYVERLYAGGIIKGSRWVKREGRPTDDAILKGRLIDRSIRPLFPKNYKREVQIIMTLMSIDHVNAPEILAAIACSAALHVSSVPWDGPISTVQIGYSNLEGKEGELIVNPTPEQKANSALDLVASTSKEKVLMIETGARQIPEQIIKEALKLSKVENAKVIDFIEEIRAEIGMEKEAVDESYVDEKLLKALKKDFDKELNTIVDEKASKESNNSATMNELMKTAGEKYKEEFDGKLIAKAIDYMTKNLIRERTLEKHVRIDGRKLDQVRELSADIDLIPRVHGTGMFNRGDTQVVSVTTLGAPGLEQLIETPEGQEEKHYIHHYSFPPYSVGETGRIGSVSRREIGHGALAEKAIEPVLPDRADFPYTIRVVSEVFTSNGSTSMASTCGSSLSLMAAGVPIKAAVGGIAMGIMSRSDEDYVILTDIMGVEDFSGEMDFKVTGTADGVTAIQLDVKNKGLTDKMIDEILDGARVALNQVLDVMNKVIAEPRAELSQYAPQVTTVMIAEDKIGAVIGPGGKMIRSIIAETGAEINVDDDGRVTITGVDKVKVAAAADIIKNLVKDVEVGEVYEGEVKRLMAFGAFVEVLPGKEGLVHVSRMANGFVKDAADVMSVGQQVKVRVFEIDQQGRINLEVVDKPDMPSQEGGGQAPPRTGGYGGGGGNRGGGYGGDRRDSRAPRPSNNRDRQPRPNEDWS
ncbi:MAG: polyribonucleotide nucleotidyltransferase [Weeksellaceae bacterium]